MRPVLLIDKTSSTWWSFWPQAALTRSNRLYTKRATTTLPTKYPTLQPLDQGVAENGVDQEFTSTDKSALTSIRKVSLRQSLAPTHSLPPLGPTLLGVLVADNRTHDDSRGHELIGSESGPKRRSFLPHAWLCRDERRRSRGVPGRGDVVTVEIEHVSVEGLKTLPMPGRCQGQSIWA